MISVVRVYVHFISFDTQLGFICIVVLIVDKPIRHSTEKFGKSLRKSYCHVKIIVAQIKASEEYYQQSLCLSFINQLLLNNNAETLALFIDKYFR